MEYIFSSSDLGISETGMYLKLSNGYNILEYSEISSIRMEKGFQSNNMLVSFFIGILILAADIWYMLKLVDFFNDQHSHRIERNMVALPLIPFLVALYLIYVSFKRTTVMYVSANDNLYRISLDDFVRKGEDQLIVDFLRVKMKFGFQDLR